MPLKSTSDFFKEQKVFIGHSTKKQQNTHFSQVLMEHSPG